MAAADTANVPAVIVARCRAFDGFPRVLVRDILTVTVVPRVFEGELVVVDRLFPAKVEGGSGFLLSDMETCGAKVLHFADGRVKAVALGLTRGALALRAEQEGRMRADATRRGRMVGEWDRAPVDCRPPDDVGHCFGVLFLLLLCSFSTAIFAILCASSQDGECTCLRAPALSRSLPIAR